MAVGHDRPDGDRWTVDDYMALDDDQRRELLRGELLVTPSPNTYHQRTITKLGTALDAHVTEHELGECFHAPFDVVLADDTVVQPDFTFVRAERFAELYDGHCVTGAPDLVVEVVSPATAVRDRHRKRSIYADAGVPWLVLVDPKSRVIEVFRLRDDGDYAVTTTAADDDVLSIDLFPDLELELSELWFDPPEDDGVD